MTGAGAGSVVPPSEDAVWRQIRSMQEQLDAVKAAAAGASALASEFSARSTYASSNNGFSTSFSSNLGSTSTGVSIALTLATPRVVLLVSKVDATMNVSLGGSLLPTHTTFLDGVIKGQANASFSVGGAASSGANSALVWPLVGVHLITASAGSHTLTTAVSAAVAAPANGQFTGPSLTAFVLQAV